MLGPEFAAAFGMPEDRMADLLNAQTETTIFRQVVEMKKFQKVEVMDRQGVTINSRVKINRRVRRNC
jgi:hypothetical protein